MSNSERKIQSHTYALKPSTHSHFLSRKAKLRLEKKMVVRRDLVKFSPPIVLEELKVVERSFITKSIFKHQLVQNKKLTKKKKVKCNLGSYLSEENILSLAQNVIQRSEKILRILSKFNDFDDICLMVNIIDDNEVLLEWFFEERDLSIYVTDESIEYIKSWGINVVDEMEDGVLRDPYEVATLWFWLTKSS